MPFLSDRAAIRAILETDRTWSVYALGDLAPGQFEHCEWFAGGGGLAMLYRRFAIPVLFLIGDAPLDELPPQRRVALQVRPGALPALDNWYEAERLTPMWRMALNSARFRPAEAAGAVRLGASDLPDVEALYADGQTAHESPDFFFPSMLSEGFFFGIREHGALVSIAGTHLVSPEESVAAIGNVYTRRDRRGRGFGSRATTAVADALVACGVRTIALNVNQHNAGAIRIYERLGFDRYCEFFEGVGRYRADARASRVGSPLIV